MFENAQYLSYVFILVSEFWIPRFDGSTALSGTLPHDFFQLEGL